MKKIIKQTPKKTKAAVKVKPVGVKTPVAKESKEALVKRIEAMDDAGWQAFRKERWSTKNPDKEMPVWYLSNKKIYLEQIQGLRNNQQQVSTAALAKTIVSKLDIIISLLQSKEQK